LRTFDDASAIDSIRVAGDACVAYAAINGYEVARILGAATALCSHEHIPPKLFDAMKKSLRNSRVNHSTRGMVSGFDSESRVLLRLCGRRRVRRRRLWRNFVTRRRLWQRGRWGRCHLVTFGAAFAHASKINVSKYTEEKQA
jgi:hypothetical protein